MTRGGGHFSSEELVRVLSHYDIGVINHIKPLSAGGSRAPKLVVVSEQGKFLLKRRLKRKDDLCHVAFAHAVQKHLAKKAFPVTSLVATRDKDSTILQLENHIYELFKFVTGVRYDGSAEATIDTGRQLGKFHRHLADFGNHQDIVNQISSGRGALTGSFHDSSTVRRHLKTIEKKKPAGPNPKSGREPRGTPSGDEPHTSNERATSKALLSLYNESSIRVNRLGFDSWDRQVVHGDWHPGNMLFSEHKLAVVLDFDLVQIAPAVTDLANGMLQFSIIGGQPNPADWPDYFDQEKLVQFLNGYRQVIKLEKDKLDSLLDLMIETMIAEAVLPVAATGFFGNLSGLDFLKMIRRKVEWIDKNRKILEEAIGS